MKKSLSIIISLVMLMLIVPLNCFVTVAATAPFEGAGTADNPYKITSAKDLMILADLVNDADTAKTYRDKVYSQTKDIDLGGVAFEPIGNYRDESQNSSFAGTYEGNYHSITGLNVDSESSYGALFACLTGKVNNLSVYGEIHSGNTCGGIAGHVHGGVITNCSFSGIIESPDATTTGGIVGSLWRSGEIKNSYFNGVLSISADKKNIGGLVGKATAGYQDSVEHIKITNSYAVGTINVSGTGNFIGGICGQNSISNSDSTITMKNNYYLSTMAKGGVNNEKTSGCTNFNANALKACADMLGSPFKDNNRSDGFNDGYPVFEWQTDPYQFSGAGTSDNPYLIETKQDLFAMRDLLCSPFFNSKYNTKSFKQIADIDMENENWASQQFRFNGTYDGNNKIISNYELDADFKISGFIPIAEESAVIKNLVIIGNAKGIHSVGGITGTLHYGATIENCAFIGNVDANKNLNPQDGYGGISGYIWQGAKIKNCYHYGSVSGKGSGGIVGVTSIGETTTLSATIENCYHAGGNISSESAGGIVGTVINKKPESCSVNLINNYFLKGTAKSAIGNGTADNDDTYAYPENVMKMLASDLGYPYTSNDDNTIIDGYPVFCWQVEATTKGDINNDGKVTIADAVILQRHILRCDTLTTRNWKAADLCEDNCIDAFDMVMMRRLLLKQDKVKVPNVVGKTEAEATDVLNKLGLEIVTAYETNDEVSKGTVISQTPKDSEVISGSTITLKISSGLAVILPNKLELNRTSKTLNLAENSDIKLQLKATVSPSDATDKKINWTSSDPKVATVSSDGLVTAVANGKATITAKTNSGDVTATCVITVVTEWTYSEWGAWSEYSTKKVEKSDLCDVETKEVKGYTDWGSWSGWSTNAVTSNDLKQVETKTEQEVESYNIDYYCTRTWDRERQFRNFSINPADYGLDTGYGQNTTQTAYGVPYLVKTPAELNAVDKIAPGAWSKGSQAGQNCAKIDGYSFDGCIFYICGTNYRDVTYYRYRERSTTSTTQYRYRERTKSPKKFD